MSEKLPRKLINDAFTYFNENPKAHEYEWAKPPENLICPIGEAPVGDVTVEIIRVYRVPLSNYEFTISQFPNGKKP